MCMCLNATGICADHFKLMHAVTHQTCAFDRTLAECHVVADTRLCLIRNLHRLGYYQYRAQPVVASAAHASDIDRDVHVHVDIDVVAAASVVAVILEENK